LPISQAGTLEDFVVSRVDGCDGLCLARPTLVPEIQLYLADDAIVLRARLEARAGRRLAPPFRASAWVGGQALARYLLDHAEEVAGRRVLDVASGSGLVAIAAALVGAARVTANDIDQDALAAVTMNAQANNVPVDVRAGVSCAPGERGRGVPAVHRRRR
jgi:predicted nicotinamide N-methyase